MTRNTTVLNTNATRMLPPASKCHGRLKQPAALLQQPVCTTLGSVTVFASRHCKSIDAPDALLRRVCRDWTRVHTLHPGSNLDAPDAVGAWAARVVVLEAGRFVVFVEVGLECEWLVTSLACVQLEGGVCLHVCTQVAAMYNRHVYRLILYIYIYIYIIVTPQYYSIDICM